MTLKPSLCPWYCIQNTQWLLSVAILNLEIVTMLLFCISLYQTQDYAAFEENDAYVVPIKM